MIRLIAVGWRAVLFVIVRMVGDTLVGMDLLDMAHLYFLGIWRVIWQATSAYALFGFLYP